MKSLIPWINYPLILTAVVSIPIFVGSLQSSRIARWCAFVLRQSSLRLIPIMSSDMDAQLKNLQGQLQVERQCAVNERRLREQAESRTKQERHHAEQERKFTEKHRKVLNDLIRQNPELMSSIFSLLDKNRLRLNEYILYVFGQTRRPLAVSRAKICPGSRSEMSSTLKPQKRRYEVSRSTRTDSSRLIESDYLWCLLETFSM